MAHVISLVMLIVYLLFIFYAGKEWVHAFRKIKWIWRLIFLVLFLSPGVLLLVLLAQERFVYTWDYANYWIKALEFSQLFFQQPFHALRQLYHSVNYDEYSLLPNLLLAPINQLLGLSFPQYVLSIYLVYLIPLSILISSLGIKLLPITNNYMRAALPLACILFTPLLIAMRFGMPDMVGLVIVFWILNALVSTNFLIKRDYKFALVIGLMLTLLLFTRRWYIFWTIAYFPTLLFLNAIQAFIHKDRSILLNTMFNLLISGVVIAGIVLGFFYPYFKMSALKDYRDLYTAYRTSGFSQLLMIGTFYGLFVLLLTVGGAWALLRQVSSRKLMFFLLVSTLIIVVLFTRINSFGGQHYYLLAPLVVISFLFGTLSLKVKRKKLVLWGVAVTLVLNVVSVFIYPIHPNPYLLSGVDARPLMRDDFDIINKLSHDLTEVQENENYVYVLASSHSFNEQIIKNVHLPTLNVHGALLPTFHVDKRDGFPNHFFLANYVVVTDPTQTHLRETDQQIIAYLNKQVLNGVLKDRYETVRTYDLEAGVTAYLKRKVSVPSAEELSEIKEHFFSLYPDHPNIHEISEPLARVYRVTKGDSYAEVAYWDSELTIAAGPLRPSRVAWSLDSTKSYTVDFGVALAAQPESAAKGEVVFNVYADGQLVKSLYLANQIDTVLSMDFRNVSTLLFEVDKGKVWDRHDRLQLNDFKITQN